MDNCQFFHWYCKKSNFGIEYLKITFYKKMLRLRICFDQNHKFIPIHISVVSTLYAQIRLNPNNINNSRNYKLLPPFLWIKLLIRNLHLFHPVFIQ